MQDHRYAETLRLDKRLAYGPMRLHTYFAHVKLVKPYEGVNAFMLLTGTHKP